MKYYLKYKIIHNAAQNKKKQVQNIASNIMNGNIMNGDIVDAPPSAQ